MVLFVLSALLNQSCLIVFWSVLLDLHAGYFRCRKDGMPNAEMSLVRNAGKAYREANLTLYCVTELQYTYFPDFGATRGNRGACRYILRRRHLLLCGIVEFRNLSALGDSH